MTLRSHVRGHTGATPRCVIDGGLSTLRTEPRAEAVLRRHTPLITAENSIAYAAGHQSQPDTGETGEDERVRRLPAVLRHEPERALEQRREEVRHRQRVEGLR